MTKTKTPLRRHCSICRAWLRIEYLDDRSRCESSIEQEPLFEETP